MSEPAPASDAGDAHDAAMFWGILEAAPDGFVMVDAAGVIVLINRQTEVLFGFDRRELIGRPVECLLPAQVPFGAPEPPDPLRRRPAHAADGHGPRSRGPPSGRHRVPGRGEPQPTRRRPHHRGGARHHDRRDAELKLRAAEENVQLLEERERIARDLHDHVIQRLFAAGMALEGSVAHADPDVAERIARVVDDLDDTIRQLRSVIFDLQDHQRGSGLRAEMLRVAAEARPALGFKPRIRFEGPVDTLGRSIAEHVLAVLREALSNVARHAHATTVDVRVVAAPGGFRLDVSDDGIGVSAERRWRPRAPQPRRARRGPRGNLHHRARTGGRGRPGVADPAPCVTRTYDPDV